MKPRWTPVALLVVLGVCLGQQLALTRLSAHNEILAKEYEDAISSGNRTLRSRSDFQLPGIVVEDLKAISVTAMALSWPWQALAAAEKTENGGMHLELGIQNVPLDIRENFPPELWQRAAGVRIMQEEAGKMIMQDPDVTLVFAARLARRWKAADPAAWQNTFIFAMNKWRGDGLGARPAKPVKPKRAKKRKVHR